MCLPKKLQTIGADGKSSPPNPAHRNRSFFFPDSDHPMIRPCLLAGANHAWKTGETPQARHGRRHPDGSRENSQMNLSNTELVVLSACETGLGDIRRNEGVYGLQRPFRSQEPSTIMSLRQVPSKQTSIINDSTFSKKWLPPDAEAKRG
ncbi:MAG: CHAT domain-containing protein [Lewinellaceae bacterium]|nr:CHAT domain-containing protein [Lewinellaceae bacterium]